MATMVIQIRKQNLGFLSFFFRSLLKHQNEKIFEHDSE